MSKVWTVDAIVVNFFLMKLARLHTDCCMAFWEIRNIFINIVWGIGMLWTLEKLRKTIFCYKMINFLQGGLKLSGNMYFSYTERLALAKVEKVLWLQKNDTKVTLLLIHHISSF